MKLHHIRDFIGIAQARSMRAAARELGIAQPALTRSLQELETELGTPLLERHARGVAGETGDEGGAVGIGELEVEDHQIRTAAREGGASGLRGAGGGDFVAGIGEGLGHEEEEALVVIDDEQAPGGCGRRHGGEGAQLATSGRRTSVTNRPRRRMASAKRS